MNEAVREVQKKHREWIGTKKKQAADTHAIAQTRNMLYDMKIEGLYTILNKPEPVIKYSQQVKYSSAATTSVGKR